VAQAVGAGDRPAVARALQRGLVLAGMLSLPTALLLLTAAPVLRGFGQPLDVVPLAAAYAVRMIPGVPSFFAFVVCRQTLQAMARLRPIVVVIVLANLTNVALNWVMIYGHLGLPTMGVIGSAWSTTISRVLMGFAIVGLAWPELGPSLLPVRPGVFAWPPLRRMLGIGVPIGLQYQLEYGVFATVALLMGRLGTVPVAAHQVAINLASLTFMVPLGVSAAATVLVGHAVGRADAREASRAARAALATGVAFMCATALLMLALPEPLARAYSRDPAVIALAASLLPIAGAFQIFDGIQVVSIGILRGLADTRGPFVIGLLGFWLLGFPVSLWLGFGVHRGPAGLWWGLVVGLAAVAMLLLARVRARLRRGVRRVLVDAPEAA
ncbi:MAG TPA: MATE family efflux transporter, partial [Gemmatimonadales bacterium]|nr:MATE family efflux transporter [Gemmatimonadales bacterium]